MACLCKTHYKVSRTFTINLGVRYDIEQQPNETRGNGSNFNLITGQVETMQQLGRDRIQDTDNNNFGPRIGICVDAVGFEIALSVLLTGCFTFRLPGGQLQHLIAGRNRNY